MDTSVRVISIVPLDKRRKKITFEDGSMLALYGGEIRRYSIEEGADCPEAAIDEIVNQILCKRARERTLYFLKVSDKTEAQVRRKLMEGFYPDRAIEYAVEFAKKYGYIDDERFVRNYLERGKDHKSRSQMVFELRQKGVSREILEQALLENPLDEELAVRRYFERKHICLDESDASEIMRCKRALMRKGFSFEAVLHVFNDHE